MSGNIQRWQPTRVTPLIREILHRKLMGQSNKEIAKAIRRTPQWVGMICRSPLFKIELSKLQEKIEGRFTRIHEEAQQVDARLGGALNLLGELAENAEKESVRVDALKHILDRAYGKPTQPVAISLGLAIPDEILEKTTRVMLEE